MRNIKIHNQIMNSLQPAKPVLIALALAAVPMFFTWAQSQPVLPPPQPVVSTIPANGDINPYGVAFVPHHAAAGLTLQPDDILVTNFNNSQNLQGIGTTIVTH
jgi:hypothetical protein